MVADLAGPILTAADLGGCLGLDAKVNFVEGEPGMMPVISGFVCASLATYKPLLELLDPDLIIPTNPAKLLDFPIKLGDLIKPEGLVNLIVDEFNANAPGMPAIPINLLGIDVNVGSGPALDIVQIQPLIDFIIGLLMIPINFILGLIESLISLEIPAPTLDGIIELIEGSLGSIPMPPGLPATFANCLLKVFLGIVNLFLALFKLPPLPLPL